MQILNSVKLQSKLSERRPGVVGGPVSIISCLFKKNKIEYKNNIDLSQNGYCQVSTKFSVLEILPLHP